ncbi:MAG: hypothetical protein FJ014_16740 [Chloroflexi bacterium]|nr:hypothetical protein [Chloroflexota bacterium]
MLATERLLEIEEAFGEKVRSIVPLELDGETLRLILYLQDGTNLRVTEQWQELSPIPRRAGVSKKWSWQEFPDVTAAADTILHRR